MGRHENTDEADRVCFYSSDTIESEEYIILHCPLYDLRNVLFDHANDVNSDLINIMCEEKLIFLLGNGSKCNYYMCQNPM